MKRRFILIVCACTFLFTCVFADNDKSIQIGQLPIKSQKFISKYFQGLKVAIVKQESDLFRKSYDVIFTNGDKLEFDGNGDWSEVTSLKNGVPEEIIPVRIKEYLKSNYPEDKVLKLERDEKGYEVNIANIWEIKFDSDFTVIDMDN